MHYPAHLIGFGFRTAEDRALLMSASPDTPLTFERDPENKYDSNAIKVLLADSDGFNAFVGYVSRDTNAGPAMDLDNGFTLTGTLRSTELFGEGTKAYMLIDIESEEMEIPFEDHNETESSD